MFQRAGLWEVQEVVGESERFDREGAKDAKVFWVGVCRTLGVSAERLGLLFPYPTLRSPRSLRFQIHRVDVERRSLLGPFLEATAKPPHPLPILSGFAAALTPPIYQNLLIFQYLTRQCEHAAMQAQATRRSWALESVSQSARPAKLPEGKSPAERRPTLSTCKYPRVTAAVSNFQRIGAVPSPGPRP